MDRKAFKDVAKEIEDEMFHDITKNLKPKLKALIETSVAKLQQDMTCLLAEHVGATKANGDKSPSRKRKRSD